ncbi:septum formation family protein [Rhodococcus spongiicola]|uniref:Septum formation-related domain-containing protein n=1 Tax=Rhodococcus spongiicola TaxID=2487352 RepID=A0A438AUZ0_9NOCA|nr:septum formation family protein [Rhodococcus spongiicola]RVW02551.1 hypothetical protein EF834_11525 [Rhodococcus spongiicola]
MSQDETEPTSSSAQQPKRRRHLSARVARRALALVASGGVLAAGATILLSGGFDRGENLATPSAKVGPQLTGAIAGEAFGSAGEGDCLAWSNPDASDLEKVDCAQTHQFEVARDIDLGAYPGVEFGPGSRFPGVLRFSELRDDFCGPAVNTYLNGRFDPKGKFSVGLINPGEAGWAAGERTIRCGLQFSGVTGISLPIEGLVAEQDQSKIWDVDTCIGLSQGVPSDPVDCAQPHAFEVVGVIDMASEFPGAMPSVEDQDKLLEKACTDASADYLGSPEALRDKTLTLFWDNLDLDSWLVGSRKINCSIGKEIDGNGFATIVGSAKGDILIDGQAPVPPPPIGSRALPTPLPGAAPFPGA